MAKRKTIHANVAAPAKVVAAPEARAARKRIGKAYELLADQPASLAGLSPEDRGNVVISAVLDDVGNTMVLSRAKDLVWEMWPFVTTPNTNKNKKRLDWSGIPEVYREACQNVLYRYWKVGRPGSEVPGVSSLVNNLNSLRIVCRFADRVKLESLVDMGSFHVANFVHERKKAGLVPATLNKQFSTVELLYLFRSQHDGALQVHPWPDSSAMEMAGMVGEDAKDSRKVALTPLIPVEVAQCLYRHARGILGCADALLDERDRGERSVFRVAEIIGIRDACFYLLGVLTGMRSSELSSIEIGAGRTEVKNGITFHWVASVEHKTKKGRVEYLMPSMGHDILRILERWSQPYRERLAEQIAAMEKQKKQLTPEELQWLATARSNTRKLFLGNGSSGIVPVSGTGWTQILTQFALDAGTNWKLAAHQMRRLYAYTFVRHRLGDLLFLKEQFKHSSIDMTQLYGAIPVQDAGLYDDILIELMTYKAGVVAQWLEKDEPLAGGAGLKIKQMRAHDFEGRKELLTETSHRINIRSTGHSWCLAQDEGCGGSGIYAKGTCSECGNGLIDSRFIPIWQEAYRHHKELKNDAAEMGPGVVKRVERDLAQAAKILKDLGVQVDAGDEDAQVASR
ncbi:site-specific integrase [Rhodoferax ferrireducens]|uniref:site-specific integrase n=1 Tax=Rhodoferax ferrireducens TaxID=192843 RepID=UPI000E0DC3AA|nr:site-specific integrase [Rhodoferax ferrireducens]